MISNNVVYLTSKASDQPVHTCSLIRAFASRLNILLVLLLLTEHHLEFLSLRVGCMGSSESTFVEMPHCWKSHVGAQIVLVSLWWPFYLAEQNGLCNFVEGFT